MGDFGGALLGGLGAGGGDGDVPHFALALHALFAVEVQVYAREVLHGLPGRGAGLAVGIEPDVAQYVEHDGGAVLARLGQGELHGGAHLQVKLAVLAGIDGVVAAVVWARCHFIDDPAAVLQHKVLYAQHAYILQALRNAGCGLHQIVCQRGRHSACKGVGGAQNAVVVDVALRRKMHDLPLRVARHDDRAL